MVRTLTRVLLVLALALTNLSVAPCHADEAAPAAPSLPSVTAPTTDGPFTGVWVDDTATLSDDTLQQMVSSVIAQQADPQHIVVLVHGFATPRDVSAKQFAQLSKDLTAQYQRLGQRIAVVGLQWDSNVGDPKDWLRKVIRSTMSGGKNNPYLAKVALARNVGVSAGRQMMLTLQRRFPNAAIDVYAHSLGSDVTRNMVAWHLDVKPLLIKGAPAPLPAYAPDEPLHFNLVALAGADLDYDLFFQGNAKVHPKGATSLFWMTVGGIRNPDVQDMALTFRAFARGRAMGNTLPHFHRAQIDMLCKTRRVVFDTFDIPTHHEFLKYYDNKRLTRIVDAAVALTDPNVHSALLDTLDEIIKAPADPNAMAKYLDRKDTAITYYALWRLENMLCGHPRHLEDGYLQRMGLLLFDDPKAIAHERWVGPCLVVRKGYFPTPKMVDEAIERLPGQEGRPKMPGFEH